MEDQLLKLFSWLTPVFQHPSIAELPLDDTERLVVNQIRSKWGNTDTADLLKELSKKYGDLAIIAVGKVITSRIREDWAATGINEAHEGTEITDFIHLLWEPLSKEGFEFNYETSGSNVAFCVTNCPVHNLAESTGLHKWLYQLACATDFHSACSFSPKIEFTRTKTLMEGHDHCNHTYSYKTK